MTEIWRTVRRAGQYEVSNKGRLRHRDRRRILKLMARRDTGRLGVTVSLQYCYMNVYLNMSIIVAEAFIGLRPEGCITKHKDGNPRNNCVSNLYYKKIRLTREEVEKIREAHQRGTSCSELGRQYGKKSNTINDLVHHKTWK